MCVQTAVQAYLLFSGIYKGSPISIISSIISSIFITCLWSLIIFLEGRKNGMSFSEYTTVIFQGSFNFVPMLPAIERGSPNGEKVNWTYYKLNPEAVGNVGKALLNRNCRLDFMKISTYTLSTLHRFGAKYFGSMISNSPLKVEICVGRLEEEIRALFEKYDTDNDWSFDFWEFTRLSLMLKQAVKERCIREDVNQVFLDLADSIEKKVWLLDLIVKIRGSVERIPLLDFDSPLDYALDQFNFKLMSFLMAYDYDETSEYAEKEFQTCCTRAVTYDPDLDSDCQNMTGEEKKERREASIAAAMCLCEDKGVPIVVRVLSGQDLLPMDEDGKSDPYVRVDCLGVEESTSVRPETLNPSWEEDLLFILPFETTSLLLAHANAEKGGSSGPPPSKAGSSSLANVNETSEENVASQFGVRQTSNQESEKIKKGLQVPDVNTLPKYVSKYKIDVSSFNMSSENLVEYKSHSQLHPNGGGGGTSVSAVTGVDEEKEFPAVPIGDMDKQRSDSGMITAVRPNSPFSRYSRAKSKMDIGGSNSSKLVIKFKIHDRDVDDEDDFMGSHKIRVDLSQNTTDFHEELQRVQVSHHKYAPGKAGYLEFRIYLNVLQYYQDHGLAFIDKIDGSNKFRIKEDEKFEKMSKGDGKEQQLVFTV